MNIAIFCGSSSKVSEKYHIEASKLSKEIAKLGHTIVYGGSAKGMMGSVSNSALKEGGRVVGVEIKMFRDQGYINPNLKETIIKDDFPSRKSEMIRLSDMFITLPGGIGTLDELSEVICLSQFYFPNKKIIVFNQDNYYDYLIKLLEKMKEEGFLEESLFKVIHFPKTVQEIIDIIKEKAQ